MIIIKRAERIHNEIKLIWGSEAQGSRGRAPSTGRFLRLFNENDVIFRHIWA